MGTKENIQRWLESPLVDEKTKEEMKHLSQEALDDAFFKDVEFGTGGMRGVLGPGTNRLNEFVEKVVNI